MVFILIVLLCLPPAAWSFELNNSAILRGCPFIHEDANGRTIDLLDHVIRSHLQTKIEGNQRCEAAFRNVVNNFDSINQIFTRNINPSLPQDISTAFLQKRIAQLEADLLATPANTTVYSSIYTEILRTNQLLLTANIDQSVNRQLFKQQRTNDVLNGIFQHLSDAITVLAKLDPTCMAQLGDWHTVLPVVLNMASSLSSLAGTTPFAVLGAGMKVLNSITFLLRDIKAKQALRALVRNRNSKLLACTYYIVQNAACDYRRHLNFSKEHEHIRELISQRYVDKDTKVYEEFYFLQQQSRGFESIFFEISSMGSAVTLDVDVMTKYFRAKRSSPDTILSPDDIGPPPADTDAEPDADFRRQAWLIKIKARGISFQERDQQGNLKTLKAQITEALTDITNKRADITSVESLVTQIRSFIDLKHRLDEDPSNLARVRRFKDYFTRILQQHIIPTQNMGLVMGALRVLDALEQFLSIRAESFFQSSEPISGPPLTDEQQNVTYEAYYAAVNKAGRVLFERMSEGAVAQVDQQTVLTIGNIVQERLDRVFTLIENEFYRRESQLLLERDESTVKYSDFIRDRSVLVDVAMNYNIVSGSGTTFRAEDITLAMNALEKGFKEEIREMIRESFNKESIYLPDLKGSTAAHLCALFAPSLKEGKFDPFIGGSLFKKCKKHFQELELYGVFSQKSIPILWDEPCFYFNYQNLLETHRVLYESMLRNGFFQKGQSS